MIKNKCGFTIIELLIAMMVTILAIGFMYNAYLSSYGSWEDADLSSDLQAQARNALNFMTSELLGATRSSTLAPSANILIPGSPNNTAITFCLPGDINGDGLITNGAGQIEWNTANPIQYKFFPAQNSLCRIENGVKTNIALNVADVRFIDAGIDSSLAINEMKIILTLTRNTSRQRLITFSLTSTVRLRN